MSFLKKMISLMALSVLATLGFYVVAIGSSESEPQEKYIDMHTHVACAGAEKPTEDTCYVEPRMKNSFKYTAYMKAFGVTKEELAKNDLAVFDSLIKKIKSSKRLRGAVVLSLDGVINKRTQEIDWKKTQFYVPGSFVLNALKTRASGVLYYGASVNPYRKDAIERLIQAKQDGAVLIKWIPSIMYIDPSDPQLVEFYKKMVELDLVLLTHTGKESSFNDAVDQLADPMRLLLPLNLGVKIIAAHVATTGTNEGEKDFDRLAKLMKSEKYKNQLFADISAITQINRVKQFKSLVQNPIFKDRFVHGTDWPLIDVSFFGVDLTPYRWYHLPWLNVLTKDQVRALDAIPNSFDRDLRMKEFFGIDQATFQRSESLLDLPEQAY